MLVRGQCCTHEQLLPASAIRVGVGAHDDQLARMYTYSTSAHVCAYVQTGVVLLLAGSICTLASLPHALVNLLHALSRILQTHVSKIKLPVICPVQVRDLTSSDKPEWWLKNIKVNLWFYLIEVSTSKRIQQKKTCSNTTTL